MKRILPCVFLLLFGMIQPAFAAEFSNAYIRLDRMQAQSTLSGLVCATPPSSTGTEAKVDIIFPSDFSINSVLSTWSTSTLQIPSGSSPWPGIGSSPLTISGTTVTFSSSDLSGGTTYCFIFSASSSKTGSAGTKTGYITTRTAGNAQIHSTEYGVRIVGNDRVSVNGTVPAQPTDYIATLQKTTSGDTFPQDATITYELRFNATLAYPSDITVQAEWSRGTITGDTSPSVDVLTYVIGSATNFGNSEPVIDSVNRTISWHISAFTGSGVDQTVSFQLKTLDTYTDAKKINFTTNGRVIGPGTQTPDSAISSSYLYNYSAPNTPNNSSITATPTPSNSMQLLTIDNIRIQRIGSSEASIILQTSLPANYTIRYGVSQTSLTKQVSGLTIATQHTITLSGLSSGTTYYFQITSNAHSGTKVSDIYSFTTSTGKPVDILPSLLVTESGVILLNEFLGKLYVPTGHHPTLQLQFPQQAIIKDLQLLFYNAANHSLLLSGNTLLESQNNFYQGELTLPDTIGVYDVYARIRDYSGNITETKFMTVTVLYPLAVVNGLTHEPIDHARIVFSKKNTATRLFTFLPSTSYFQNPSYTNQKGIFTGLLTPGEYEVTVTAIGYTDTTAHFTIAENGYPVVTMQPLPFNLITGLKVFTSKIAMYFSSMQGLLQNLAVTKQSFFILTGFGFIFLAWTTLLSFANKLHISLSALPWYIAFGLPLSLFPHMKKPMITGVIRDEKTTAPIVGARIRLVAERTQRVLAHTTSSNDGSFALLLHPGENLRITIQKHGYSLYDVALPTKRTDIKIRLTQNTKESRVKNVFSIVKTELGHFIFEGFLLLSVAVILIFGSTFGIFQVLPLVLTTSLCCIYWMLHLLHERQIHEK